jgi:predicted nucleotidyltransferase component of viral defense system
LKIPKILGCDPVTRIMDILELMLDEIKKDNPYGLVLKGGTALALHHLHHHRESEDLDFDIPVKYLPEYETVSTHLKAILMKLKSDGRISNFQVRKEGFSSKAVYHMNLAITTHRQYLTKFDLSFLEMPHEVELDGQLGFYTAKRMLVMKLLTFVSRENLKDVFDIYHLLRLVKPSELQEPNKVADLVDKVIDRCEQPTLITIFKKTLENIDLHFQDLKEKDLLAFIEKTTKALKIFRNQLRRSKS